MIITLRLGQSVPVSPTQGNEADNAIKASSAETRRETRAGSFSHP